MIVIIILNICIAYHKSMSIVQIKNACLMVCRETGKGQAEDIKKKKREI